MTAQALAHVVVSGREQVLLGPIGRVDHWLLEQLRHLVRKFGQQGGLGQFDEVSAVLPDRFDVERHIVDGARLLPRVQLHDRAYAQRRGLHAHAETPNPLAIAEGGRATEGRGDLQHRRRHARAIVVDRSVDLVGASLAGLPKVHPDFCRARLEGVVDVLAEGRRRVVITDVA